MNGYGPDDDSSSYYQITTIGPSSRPKAKVKVEPSQTDGIDHKVVLPQMPQSILPKLPQSTPASPSDKKMGKKIPKSSSKLGIQDKLPNLNQKSGHKQSNSVSQLAQIKPRLNLMQENEDPYNLSSSKGFKQQPYTPQPGEMLLKPDPKMKEANVSQRNSNEQKSSGNQKRNIS